MAEQKPQAHAIVRAMKSITEYFSQDFLGGPRPFKLSSVINFQKGSTVLYVLGLMWYFNKLDINQHPVVWVYLALHGTYGFCWLLKHFAFPDAGWDVKATLGGAVMSFVMVLGLYWIFPYLLISEVLAPTPQLSFAFLAFVIGLHTMGVVLMIAADAQKYFTLKYKRGLIDGGMFRHVRHTNYLGEMMLYASYALLVQHWIPWAILAWVWIGVFLMNMLTKEASLSRYPGWKEYKARSGMLFPWPFGSEVGGTEGVTSKTLNSES